MPEDETFRGMDPVVWNRISDTLDKAKVAEMSARSMAAFVDRGFKRLDSLKVDGAPPPKKRAKVAEVAEVVGIVPLTTANLQAHVAQVGLVPVTDRVSPQPLPSAPSQYGDGAGAAGAPSAPSAPSAPVVADEVLKDPRETRIVEFAKDIITAEKFPGIDLDALTWEMAREFKGDYNLMRKGNSFSKDQFHKKYYAYWEIMNPMHIWVIERLVEEPMLAHFSDAHYHDMRRIHKAFQAQIDSNEEWYQGSFWVECGLKVLTEVERENEANTVKVCSERWIFLLLSALAAIRDHYPKTTDRAFAMLLRSSLQNMRGMGPQYFDFFHCMSEKSCQDSMAAKSDD
jgi:hypothetical protein